MVEGAWPGQRGRGVTWPRPGRQRGVRRFGSRSGADPAVPRRAWRPRCGAGAERAWSCGRRRRCGCCAGSFCSRVGPSGRRAPTWTRRPSQVRLGRAGPGRGGGGGSGEASAERARGGAGRVRGFPRASGWGSGPPGVRGGLRGLGGPRAVGGLRARPGAVGSPRRSSPRRAERRRRAGSAPRTLPAAPGGWRSAAGRGGPRRGGGVRAGPDRSAATGEPSERRPLRGDGGERRLRGGSAGGGAAAGAAGGTAERGEPIPHGAPRGAAPHRGWGGVGGGGEVGPRAGPDPFRALRGRCGALRCRLEPPGRLGK